jgi:outer membrane protein assembly factor BamE (lipoprotein component of BamABCDE complex)
MTMSALSRANWTSISALACVIIAVAGCTSPQMASRVDPGSIRSIKIGMTEQEVKTILGEPLRVRPWGDAAAIYDYAIPGRAVSSPGLWIYFDKGAVRTVHGAWHPVAGESHAVYEARGDQPTFESPDFESTFTRAR